MVGGFADSPVLQYELRREFDHLLKILIPQDCSLSIVKGQFDKIIIFLVKIIHLFLLFMMFSSVG